MLIVNAITTEGQGAMPYEVTELREIYAGSWRLSLG